MIYMDASHLRVARVSGFEFYGGLGYLYPKCRLCDSHAAAPFGYGRP
jgi:hypothetical protein